MGASSVTIEKASNGPVRLTILPDVPRYSLRVGAAHLAAASDAFGAALPTRIGARVPAGAGSAARSALCLGPDEWVLHTEAADASGLEAAFAAIYQAAPHSLVDISDRECGILLSGWQVEDLLSTSCPRDLSAIAVGDGVRTIFDTVPAVLLKDSETEYRIEVWRSYLPHVWGLLNTANRELASGL